MPAAIESNCGLFAEDSCVYKEIIDMRDCASTWSQKCDGHAKSTQLGNPCPKASEGTRHNDLQD